MGDPAQHHLAAAGQPIGVYRERKGNKVQLYALASENADGTAGAFFDLFNAINGAKTFIFIVDWSFQPYTRIGPRTAPATLEQTVGAQLIKRALDRVTVAINTWKHLGIPDDQNDDASHRIEEIAASLRKSNPAMFAGKCDYRDNLFFRASSKSRIVSFFSFHQKFVVLDADDGVKRVVQAFFGGLDLTKGRFDWGDHPILHDAPDVGALTPRLANGDGGRFYDDWYNAEFSTKNPKEAQPGDPSLPRQPWEDFYGNIAGPSAWDVVREFVGRWNTAGAMTGNCTDNDRQKIENVFLSLFDKGKFKQEWEDHGGPFIARVVRSMEKDFWGRRDNTRDCNTPTEDGKTKREFLWNLHEDFEKSIEESYVNAIQNAHRFIYIETQYFIGSGNAWQNSRASVTNRVPQAIVDKITEKVKGGEDFHAYIVVPMFPEGAPLETAVPAQRQFSWETMGMMANAVHRAIADAKASKKWSDYLSFYFLANWTPMDPASLAAEGTREARVRANRRYQVYVHSKLMIIDDQFLILGSANLNERSLAGNRDGEICIYLRPDEGKLDLCKAQIQDLRKTAWSQHFGGMLPTGWANPEAQAVSSLVQQKGRENWIALATGLRQDKSHIVLYPMRCDGTTWSIEPVSGTPALQYQDGFIFDAPAKAAKPANNGTIIDPQWAWYPPKTVPLIPDELAE
jgi:phospholipase D1/2